MGKKRSSEKPPDVPVDPNGTIMTLPETNGHAATATLDRCEEADALGTTGKCAVDAVDAVHATDVLGHVRFVGHVGDPSRHLDLIAVVGEVTLRLEDVVRAQVRRLASGGADDEALRAGHALLDDRAIHLHA